MATDWQTKKYSARPKTPLWEMSIPGTHDTAARYNYWANADRCQSWSVTEQLNNGIRFLDLRLNYNNDNNRDPNGFTGYDIYHGGFQNATFKPFWYGVTDPDRPGVANVYGEMVDWLVSHPGEFVVVNIANTGGTANDEYTDEFWKIITSDSKGHSTPNAPLWYLFDLVNGSKADLTYDNLKGKFVLIRSAPGWLWSRTGFPNESLGLPCGAYDINGFSTDVPFFRTQNYWEDVSWDGKTTAINQLFREIQNAQPAAQYTYFNWISRGYNGWYGPDDYAAYFNANLSGSIHDMVDGLPPNTVSADLRQPPTLGVVVMDFPTTELIGQIIHYHRREVLSVASWGSGRLDLFARRFDNTLLHKFYESGQWYDDGAALGGTILSDPAAVSWGNGRIDVFARGPGDTLLHRYYDNHQWYDWESLGGDVLSRPCVASLSTGRLDVFTRGKDNKLRHRGYDGSWGDWDSLGGEIWSDPAAVSWGNGRIDVFAIGNRNALMHRWFDNGQWYDWESLGAEVVSQLSVASLAKGRLDVFARAKDNTLRHRGYDGSWGDWDSLGGDLTSGPAAVSWGTGRIDVFVRGRDDMLMHRTFDQNRWYDWASLGVL